MLGDSEGLSLRINRVKLRCCMMRVRARLLSDGGGLDGTKLKKHGIFQPIFGAQQMARKGNQQPWERSEVRFEPIVTASFWDEAHQGCCSGGRPGSGGSRLRENMLVQ